MTNDVSSASEQLPSGKVRLIPDPNHDKKKR